MPELLENHPRPLPPQGWSCGGSQSAELGGGALAGGRGAYRDNDGGAGGKLVGDVDVHLDLGRVGAPAADLLERGGHAHGGGGHEAENVGEHHDGRLSTETCPRSEAGGECVVLLEGMFSKTAAGDIYVLP